MFGWLAEPLYDLYRRYFGTYAIDDPRPIAKEAPYTYFIPSAVHIDSLQVGDLAQLSFRGVPGNNVERMWVEITERNNDEYNGKLVNTPLDLPQLRLGHLVRFKPFHCIGFRTDRNIPESPKVREYWDRCMVDRCVLDDGIPIYYIYREEPDMTQEGDKYPDSGWRIRGDYRNVSDEEFEARKHEYIALGKVLNADDSWIHLIDSPIGSAFMRNFESGKYEPYEREPQDDDN